LEAFFMSGFSSPNYTQTPNDLFIMLPEMGECELRVTLVMVRQTFGFHRDGFRLGLRKLAAMAGLSRQGALEGSQAAEARGTFKRSNPNAQGEAEWELVVPLNQVEAPLNQVEAPPLRGGGQSGVKESIKENFKEREDLSPDFLKMSVQEARTWPTIKLYTEATEYFPGSILWGHVDSFITEHKLTSDKIRAVAIEWAARGYKQSNVKGILEWAAFGIPPSKNSTTASAAPISKIYKAEDLPEVNRAPIPDDIRARLKGLTKKLSVKEQPNA
jgi:hypothetical protein